MPEQALLESDEWRRCFRRVFNAAKDAKLPLGPVVTWDDFARYPEALADVFESACASADVSDATTELDDIIGRLEDAASDVSSAALSLSNAVHQAKLKR